MFVLAGCDEEDRKFQIISDDADFDFDFTPDEDAPASQSPTTATPAPPRAGPTGPYAIVAHGDTIAVHQPGTDTGARLLVGRVDPTSNAVELSSGRRPGQGISRLQTGDGFVAWLDHPLDDDTPVHLRLVETGTEGTPSTDATAWSPWGTTPVEVAAFALQGTYLAWVEKPDEDGNARIAVVDLASETRAPIALGEYETGNEFEIVMTSTQLVWRDATKVYALPVPFETSSIREIADDIRYATSSRPVRIDLQAAGNIVGWEFDRSVFLYDGNRPIEPDVNPRRVDAFALKTVTPRYALFVTDRAGWYWLDVRNPNAERRYANTSGPGHRTHVRLYGHHLVFSRCRNSTTRTISFYGLNLGSSTRCDALADASIWARDLEDWDAGALEIASGLRAVQELTGGALGVVWRHGTGEDEVTQYWNPSSPVAADVNPTVVGDGEQRVLDPTFTESGLAWFTSGMSGLAIEFIDAVDLLLATDSRN